MPAPLYTQTTIAFIWDFDKTLIPGNQQDPLFAAYGIDPSQFWAEVDGLVGYYLERGITIARDLAYLGHILTYVKEDRFPGLTRGRLRELGAGLEMSPGVPEFFAATRNRVAEVPDFAHEGIDVEHYVVSTGIRPMIEGSPIGDIIDGIWANDFIERPARPGYLETLAIENEAHPISMLGYTIDNTSKTRAVFEINKGVNRNAGIDVNALMAEEQRRVPIRNMIYIADGPSDVPVFSVVKANGGKTFAVYKPESEAEFEQVNRLQEQGRVDSFGEANYEEGSQTYMWITHAVDSIARRVVNDRATALHSRLGKPPGHIDE